MLRALCITVALTFILTTACTWASGQENAKPSPQGDAAAPMSHASVTMPFEDVRGLLEKGGLDRPPVEFAFSPARYDVAVTDKGVAVSASVDVTLLVDSWSLVPIGPSDSGVTAATVDGQAAPLVLRGDQLYLLLKGKGQKKVALTLARDLVADAGTVRFDLPLLPSALVDVSTTLPTGIQGGRATGGASVSITKNAQATIIKGSFHGGAVATFQWRPAPPPGVAVEARMDAEVATLVTVDRGVLRARSAVNVQIANASPKELKIDVDAKLSVDSVTGKDIAEWKETPGAGDRKTIVVRFSAEIDGDRRIDLTTERDLPGAAKEDAGKETTVDLRPPSLEGAGRDRGYIGIEVRDSIQVTPGQPGKNIQRVDVKELPESIAGPARSPVLFGYRYDAPDAKLTLAMTRNADLDVLVAMSDICEASTTYTPDGKSITKMMLITRNNLKQFMTLKMPEGAQIWSTFVGDHPVTPARDAKGQVLIPLRKSDPEGADDDDTEDGKSYRAQRERRRAEGVEGKAVDHLKRIREQKAEPDDAAPDLKPYDVEIVFVMPAAKLAERGQVHPALPQSDVPIGHLSWAIFLPANLKVVDSDGNVTEVSHFTLPFRHFGDVAYERGQHQVQEQQAMQKAMEELAAADKQAQQVAERARVQGVLPVRIEIPMVGEIHRFEKFLTVEEAPVVTLTYRRSVE